MVIKGWQADGNGRSIDLVVSNDLQDGPNGVGKVRLVSEWFVRGTDGTKETEFEVTLPVSGLQTTYRGTHYNMGPDDIVYFVEDGASDLNSELVDATGTRIDNKFTPVVL